MNTPIRNIIRRLSGREKFNVLNLAYNGFFEYDLAKTGHNIYVPLNSGNPLILSSNPAPNLYLVDKAIGDLPLHTDFDMVVISDKLAQYQLGRKIADAFHIPLVIVEHYYAMPNMRPQDLMILDGNKYDGRVQTMPGIATSWMTQECPVIRYGIDPIEIENVERKQVLLYGNFSGPDYNIISHFLEQVPNLKLCGNNPGLPSQLVTRETLIDEIKKSSVFINLTASTSIAYPMLYAMAAQCAIVTNNVDKVPSLIKPGVNGEFINDNENINAIIQRAISKKNEAAKMNLEILQDFSMKNFISSWKAIFNSISGFTYAGR